MFEKMPSISSVAFFLDGATKIIDRAECSVVMKMNIKIKTGLWARLLTQLHNSIMKTGGGSFESFGISGDVPKRKKPFF